MSKTAGNDITNPGPLYIAIAESLKSQIVDGFLAPGDQIPTEQEIAREYSVSRITARNAVKELQNLGLVVRVQGKGTFVAETVPQEGATFDQARDVGIISVVLPIGRHAGHETLSAAEGTARQLGYHLTYHNSHFDSGHEREIIERVVSSGSRGLIVYPCAGIENVSTISRLQVDGFPLVVIDRTIDSITVPSVYCTNYEGVCSLAEYVIAQGHTRIAYLGNNPLALPSERERLRGYCDSLVRAGIAIRDRYVIATEMDEYEMSEPAGPGRFDSGVSAIERAVETLMDLPYPPTCVMALNDMTAIQVFKAARKLGLDVPGDLSITGFDDLEMSAHLPVPLTTVKQSFLELGRIATEMLFHMINGEPVAPVTTIPTTLVARDSVRNLNSVE